MMNLIRFSFKREPVWILLFSLAPGIVGLLIALVYLLVIRLLR